MRVPRRPLRYRLWARITVGKYLIKMALRVPCSTRLKVWRVRYSWVAQTRTSGQQAKSPNKMTSYSKLPKNCTRVLSSTPSRMSRQLTPVWPWAAIKVLKRLVFLVMPAWVKVKLLRLLCNHIRFWMRNLWQCQRTSRAPSSATPPALHPGRMIYIRNWRSTFRGSRHSRNPLRLGWSCRMCRGIQFRRGIWIQGKLRWLLMISWASHGAMLFRASFRGRSFWEERIFWGFWT